MAAVTLALSLSGEHARAQAEPSTATCTLEQKTAREKTLTAYERRMVAERSAYFRTHKDTRARAAFVKRQRTRLLSLRRAAACTVPVAPPPPLPAAAKAEYTFADGVSADDRATVEGAIDVGAAYMQRLGVPAGFVATVKVDTAAGAIFAQDTTITVHAGNDAWSRLSSARRTAIVVHELVHVFQFVLAKRSLAGGLEDVPAGGARWLVEGAAEWIAYTAVAAAGQLDFANERARFISGARASASPLSSLETWGGIERAAPYGYAVSFAGADFAAQRAGAVALIAVWRAMGDGRSWQDAFAAVFGRSVSAFYTEFESYRKTL